MEYYTIWAHQIKTPIASMRLTLQNEDSELSRRLSEDLLRIEQYVEMVLCYLRLDSSSTDYVFQEYDLDRHCQAGPCGNLPGSLSAVKSVWITNPSTPG